MLQAGGLLRNGGGDLRVAVTHTDGDDACKCLQCAIENIESRIRFSLFKRFSAPLDIHRR